MNNQPPISSSNIMSNRVITIIKLFGPLGTRLGRVNWSPQQIVINIIRSFLMRYINPSNAGTLTLLASMALLFMLGLPQAQQSPTPHQSMSRNFDSLNQRILDMAQDFPAEKYDYRPTKEVRSFGEVMVHIISGNQYAAKAG